MQIYVLKKTLYFETSSITECLCKIQRFSIFANKRFSQININIYDANVCGGLNNTMLKTIMQIKIIRMNLMMMINENNAQNKFEMWLML